MNSEPILVRDPEDGEWTAISPDAVFWTGWCNDEAFARDQYRRRHFENHSFRAYYDHSWYSRIRNLFDAELAKRNATSNQQQSTSTNKKEIPMNKCDYTHAVKDGLAQATADEVGEALLDVASDILGQRVEQFASTPQGRELMKALMAVLLLEVLPHVPALPIPAEQVQRGARLQVQTATMRLVQPHVAKLRELGTRLAGAVQEQKKEEGNE